MVRIVRIVRMGAFFTHASLPHAPMLKNKSSRPYESKNSHGGARGGLSRKERVILHDLKASTHLPTIFMLDESIGKIVPIGRKPRSFLHSSAGVWRIGT